MKTFREIENALRLYIEEHLFDYLEKEGYSDFNAYVHDFLDFDRYRHNKILFYNFGSYHISPLTNESDSAKFSFTVYMAFRGDTPEKLVDMMKGHEDCFLEMFRDSGRNFGGAVDGMMDMDAQCYYAVEGNPTMKMCELTFQTETEI